jgi:PAS domain S-box-containing protein
MKHTIDRLVSQWPSASAEPRWAETFRQTLQALVVSDAATNRIVYATPEFARMHGYTPNEVTGMRVQNLFASDARAELGEHIRLVNTERVHVFESVHLRKDGTTFPVRIDARVVVNAEGQPAYRVVTCEDLTEQRRAAAAQAQLAAIIASSDDAIISKNLDGIVLSWNEGASRLFGYTAEEMIGRPVAVVIPPEQPDEEPSILARLARGERIEHYETVRVRKDGTRVHVSISVSPMRDASGRVIGAAKIARDITERRRTEAERAEVLERERAARAEAEQANRAKMDFLATMSHELRTPLNAIAGYVQLLEMGLHGPVTAAQRDALARVQRSQRLLLALINDILNFAKLEAGRVQIDLRDQPVHTLLADLEQLVEPQVSAKQLRYACGGCDAAIRVRTDAEKVHQILLNLLSNAIKFTDPGGTITVACARAGDDVAIRVRDTGRGIPPDKLEHIFEPFVQLGRSLTAAHEGAGLGLAISRDLARLLGGDITAESAVGAGSTFTLTLPRAHAG